MITRRPLRFSHKGEPRLEIGGREGQGRPGRTPGIELDAIIHPFARSRVRVHRFHVPLPGQFAGQGVCPRSLIVALLASYHLAGMQTLSSA